MDRRRLMDGASDRLKVLRVECEWIEITVPADDIERMMRHRHPREARAVLHQNIYIFLLVDRDAARSVRGDRALNRAHPF